MPALTKVHSAAATAMAAFQSATVKEVADTVNREPVVIIGMAWNPVVKKARRYLDEKGVKYTYLEYGNYISGWRLRLGIKLWSGWPTFPIVFVKGALVGGNKELQALGPELDRLLKG